MYNVVHVFYFWRINDDDDDDDDIFYYSTDYARGRDSKNIHKCLQTYKSSTVGLDFNESGEKTGQEPVCTN